MDDFNEFEDEELEVITLVGDGDEEFEFIVIDRVEHNGSNFLLVIENIDDEEEEPDAFLFKEVILPDGEKVYEELEDDDFKVVSKLFGDVAEDYDIE